MSWTEERISTLTKMWESGSTASQIAEELGGISRNAVIGKAHRLGLKPRPSPVKNAEPAAAKAAPVAAPAAPPPPAAPKPAAPVVAAPVAPPVAAKAPTPPKPVAAPAEPEDEVEIDEVEAEDEDDVIAPVKAPVMRSVGPGGFLRQNPGENSAPLTPAPPRRLVPARPSDAVAGKTSLLDLNDRICKWPIGHPGEPDFHFCGDKVNPGFPYCVDHCGHAYQAQLPRRDRRPPPPLPYGGPRVR
ncbi:GcrA family cell cycle regulator [Sphingomonas qomolangmaensis]|uniref:GcrA family cell cycle regulator n=1 Tax=Sphingomonas qomolangmaensis TaxID=2918765 RepID=A0ABY5LBK0_9SPHN|nr:GcrA family cell cycle regulator [Sphingomonas qomolangmaensis]UUL84325.1 GcrA family cell cycle regulator [Sphingomonas qomolangmaensis]